MEVVFTLQAKAELLGHPGTPVLLALTWSCACFLGEAAAVPVLPRREGAGVADGVSHPVHQGDRRPPRKGGSVGRPEERTGECALASPIRPVICRQTRATRLVVTPRWVPGARKGLPRRTPTPRPTGTLEGSPGSCFMGTVSSQSRCGLHSACHVLAELALQPLGCHGGFVDLTSPRRWETWRFSFSVFTEREMGLIP